MHLKGISTLFLYGVTCLLTFTVFFSRTAISSAGGENATPDQRSAILEALPESLESLSQEEIVQRLSMAGYPDSFHKALPKDVQLMPLSSLKTLPVADVRVVVQTMREQIASRGKLWG